MIYKELKVGTVVSLPEYLQKLNHTIYAIVTKLVMDNVTLSYFIRGDIATSEIDVMLATLKAQGSRATTKQGRALRKWWGEEKTKRFKKKIKYQDPVLSLCQYLVGDTVPTSKPEAIDSFLVIVAKLQEANLKKNESMEHMKLCLHALYVGVKCSEVKRFGLDMSLMDPAFGSKRQTLDEHWYSAWELYPDKLKPGRIMLQNKIKELAQTREYVAGTTWEDLPVPKPHNTGRTMSTRAREEWAMNNLYNVVIPEKDGTPIPLKTVILRPEARKWNGHQMV